MHRLHRWLIALCAAASVPASVRAQQPDESLADLSIEQLAGIRIGSASRRLQPVSHAATAIFVITREDMRRAGAATLGDALRLAPGLQVARVTGRDWSITSRGYAEQSPNKMLVVVDGRPVYSPLFAGVFWDVQTVPLEDVERIEVIEGSGATLWGSNAVNGVINVVTRRAPSTRGGMIAVRSGTAAHIGATARYGVDLGDGAAVRFYGTFADREPSRLVDGTAGEDDWRLGQGGFRLDAPLSARSRITVQGDGYAAAGDQVSRLVTPDPPFAELTSGRRETSGGNVLTRWTHTFGERSEVQVRAFYDRAVRDQPPTTGRVSVDIFDVEVLQRLSIAGRHNLVWGGGYRVVSDELAPTFQVGLVPEGRSIHLVTAFAQDEMAVVPERFFVTLGGKIERNDLSGVEVQPNARLRWMPNPRHTLWSAVSRAVRVPTRLDSDIRVISQVIPGSPPAHVRIDGNEDFESENIVAAELGYRAEVHRTFSVDLNGYHSWGYRLRSVHPLSPVEEDGVTIQRLTIGNDAKARTYGGTFAANWRPLGALLLRGSVSFVEMEVELREDAQPGAVPNINPGFNPSSFATLSSYVTLPAGLEIYVAARYVGALENPPIDEYIQADARLGWRASRTLSIGVVGQDLFAARHAEFSSLPQREIQRRAELQVEWRF